MKVAIYGAQDWQQDYFKNKLDLVTFTKDLEGDYDIISIFIDTPLTKKDLDKFPHLKLIVTRSSGFDHIDLEACKARNISVCNIPNYGKNTVAEFALALLLALSRKVFASYQVVQTTGKFIREGMTGFDLKNKTLGIIGTGNIGTEMVKIAQGLGMNIIAYDINQTLDIPYKTLEEVLKESDVISLHVPYNKHTHYLLNEKNIPLIKKGSYLINTARGPVIEMTALLNALESGQIAGAGLDVIENEDDLSSEISQRLIAHPNTIITPHNAFNTKEALIRILDTTVKIINDFKNGKPVTEIKN